MSTEYIEKAKKLKESISSKIQSKVKTENVETAEMTAKPENTENAESTEADEKAAKSEKREKSLRSLTRKELLQLMLEQSKEIERLNAELEELSSHRQSMEMRLSEAGSLAEAALELNGVFEAAQAAADQYVESIKSAERTWKTAEEEAKMKAQQVLADAEQEALRWEKAAEENCRKYEADARADVKHAWEDVEKRLEKLSNGSKEYTEILNSFRRAKKRSMEKRPARFNPDFN